MIACVSSLLGCGQSDHLTVYSLTRDSSLIYNPRTYRIDGQVVVEDWQGELTKYEKCTVVDVYNWTCVDRIGASFGANDGEFFADQVELLKVEYVSRLEYNLNRCRWAMDDRFEGPFRGAVSCIWQWQ
jgi:hypothetical protein